jgi:hypothetical protein
MNAFEALWEVAGESGELMGTNVLYEPPTMAPVTSPAHGRLRRVVGGKMLRFDYRWSLRSEAHEGTFLVACDDGGRASAAWGDSWHQNREIMTLAGEAGPGAVTLRGSWSVGDGPPWGWRVDLSPEAEGGLSMEMWVVTPEGEEARAVEMSLAR